MVTPQVLLTLFELACVAWAAVMLASRKGMCSVSTCGKLYVVLALVSGFGVLCLQRHGPFTRTHALVILSLQALVTAIWTERKSAPHDMLRKISMAAYRLSALLQLTLLLDPAAISSLPGDWTLPWLGRHPGHVHLFLFLLYFTSLTGSPRHLRWRQPLAPDARTGIKRIAAMLLAASPARYRAVRPGTPPSGG